LDPDRTHIHLQAFRTSFLITVRIRECYLTILFFLRSSQIILTKIGGKSNQPKSVLAIEFSGNCSQAHRRHLIQQGMVRRLCLRLE